MTMPEIRIVERVEPDTTKRHLFTQGNLELEVFPDDVLRSIDQIDKLPVGKWTEFAVQNDLPCDPLDRKLLKPPLMGVIMLAWHRHFKGGVSDKLIANQDRRIATYKEDLEHVKLVAASPAERTARARSPKETGTAATRTPSIGLRYRLREESSATWGQYKTQKGLIVAVMIHAGATAVGGKVITKDQITAALRGKLNTRQPEERVVGYYLSEWTKDSIVERVDDPAVPQGEVAAGFVAMEPSSAPPAPAAAAKPTSPPKQASATKSKKK